MAQKIQTLYIDDIDGSDAQGTVRFGLDGTGYEIDLSAAHSQALRESLQRFITHARKTGRPRPPRRGRHRHHRRPRLGQGSKASTSRNAAGCQPASWPDTDRPPDSKSQDPT